MAATKEDAALMVQLLQFGAQIQLQDAMSHLFQPGFDPEQASARDKPVATVLGFGETVATFVKQGVLDRGLVEDLLWIDGMWSKVGSAAKRVREEAGEPRLYENFEALAKGGV